MLNYQRVCDKHIMDQSWENMDQHVTSSMSRLYQSEPWMLVCCCRFFGAKFLIIDWHVYQWMICFNTIAKNMISMDGMLFVAFDLLGSLQQIRFAAQICRNRYPNHPTSFGRNLSSSWICVPPRIKTEEGLPSPTSRGVPLGAAIPAGELSGAGSAAGQARCHHHSRPRRESQMDVSDDAISSDPDVHWKAQFMLVY